jgi:mono/diheme cytochrome c family protein
MRLDGGLGSARISELRPKRPFVVTAAQVYWSPSERCRLGDNIVVEKPPDIDDELLPSLRRNMAADRDRGDQLCQQCQQCHGRSRERRRVGSYRLYHGEQSCRLRFRAFQGS